MTARISPEGAALAVLHGQVAHEKDRLLKLRKEQMRIAREMLVSQRHLAACLDAMDKIIKRSTPTIYTGEPLT